MEDWSIADLDLTDRVVLEVGCGRGETTRALVERLSRCPGASLIATDISDAHFDRLGEEFRAAPIPVKFVRTGARELAGIDDGSADVIVCNYALCAVDARAGEAVLALERFREVLKAGGWLFVEEEYPIDVAGTPQQRVWAKKWRILKAAVLLAGVGSPYTEFMPGTLAEMCRLVGFRDVAWTAAVRGYHGPEALDFFQDRLEWLLPEVGNDELRVGLQAAATALRKEAERVDGMEVPYYRLSARKE